MSTINVLTLIKIILLKLTKLKENVNCVSNVYHAFIYILINILYITL